MPVGDKAPSIARGLVGLAGGIFLIKRNRRERRKNVIFWEVGLASRMISLVNIDMR